MIKKWSSRWIDLTGYKTKDILISTVGRFVKLKPNKAGTVYKGICPFHNEKTPSFKIFFNKYISGWGYKCFGCGKSGDVFSFLMKEERLKFWEAMLEVTRSYIPSSPLSSCISPNQLKIPFPKEEILTKDDLPP